MENLQQASNEELLNGQTSPKGEQVDKKYSEEEYKNLQSFATKTSQEKISLAMKLVSKDKKELLAIEDKKLQNKVIKELYWLDNIDEVKLIHWDDFFKDKKEEDESIDDITKIANELKLLKYNQSKSELERAIDDYKKSNPVFFEEAAAEEKLREEIKYISSELSVWDRIRRASNIVFWTNNVNEWYRKLQWVENSFVTKTPVKENNTEVQKEIWEIFSRRFKK